MNEIKIAVVIFMGLFLQACTIKPEPIQVGKDLCKYCKMTISDSKFGAEAITTKGKIFKYDEAHCYLSEIADKELDVKDVQSIYVSNFCGQHELLLADKAYYLYSENLKSPMGGNVAVFSNKDSLQKYVNILGGKELTWDELKK